MDDVIAFIRARLGEDERDAPSVHLSDCACVLDRSVGSCDCGHPARVLREIAAKRAHLDQYEESISGCLDWSIGSVLSDVIYSDAAVWSDHSDYKPEWS
jgi:hypothetical protein